MTSITKLARGSVCLYLTAVLLVLNGCTTPASVSPLLRVAERALIEESGRLDQDIEFDRSHTRQTLKSLADAYRQDLRGADRLTPQWVEEATSVYVTARELVLANESKRAGERRARSDNLRSAATATRRAREIIERQDRLVHGIVGDDLGQLLNVLDDHEN